MRVTTAGDLGNFVREKRVESGMTQRQLAELAGVSRLWLVHVEAGHPGAESGRSSSWSPAWIWRLISWSARPARPEATCSTRRLARWARTRTQPVTVLTRTPHRPSRRPDMAATGKRLEILLDGVPAGQLAICQKASTDQPR